MRILVFSDLHCDERAARALVERAPDADLLLAAGDFAVMRQGLQPLIDVLHAIETPTILVPGNGESDVELRAACSGWTAARVLHGEGTHAAGVEVFGIGGGIPVTPFGPWSFDLSEDEARTRLVDCPAGALLVSHSPPFGHADTDGSGRSLGSRAVLEAAERVQGPLLVCGHIHASWGVESQIGPTRVINAGPAGRWVELEV
ncbi:MAG: metallophosphoesterase family protein [Gemmatimonadota bacterium]